jgi:hypothetical protein
MVKFHLQIIFVCFDDGYELKDQARSFSSDFLIQT